MYHYVDPANFVHTDDAASKDEEFTHDPLLISKTHAKCEPKAGLVALAIDSKRKQENDEIQLQNVSVHLRTLRNTSFLDSNISIPLLI